MKNKILILGLVLLFVIPFIYAENQTVQSCKDSDNGKDYFVKGYGTVTFSDGMIGTNEEGCYDSGKKQSDAPIECTAENGYGNGLCVVEQYCNDDGTQGYEIYKCPNGCNDGACINNEQQGCTDSDGGKDYYKKGVVIGPLWSGDVILTTPDVCISEKIGSDVTSCSGNDCILAERYCENNLFKTESYSCPMGCTDGACINNTKQKCIDSDNGRNYYIKGTATGLEKSWVTGEYQMVTSIDGCNKPDGKTLGEVYCEGDYLKVETYICPGSCVDGACLKSPDKEKQIGYWVAYVACYDGYDEGISDNTICRSPSDWKDYTNKVCENRCNADKTKCGVNTLKLSTECSKETNQQLPIIEPTTGNTELINGSVEPIDNRVILPIQEPIAIEEKDKMNCGSCLITQNSKLSCIPFGTRYQGQYCEITQNLLKQKQLDEQCENNYECLSNECSNGKCISTYNLLQKIMNWLSNLFK